MTPEEAIAALLEHDACATDGTPLAAVALGGIARLRARVAELEAQHREADRLVTAGTAALAQLYAYNEDHAIQILRNAFGRYR